MPVERDCGEVTLPHSQVRPAPWPLPFSQDSSFPGPSHLQEQQGLLFRPLEWHWLRLCSAGETRVGQQEEPAALQEEEPRPQVPTTLYLEDVLFLSCTCLCADRNSACLVGFSLPLSGKLSYLLGSRVLLFVEGKERGDPRLPGARGRQRERTDRRGPFPQPGTPCVTSSLL